MRIGRMFHRNAQTVGGGRFAIGNMLVVADQTSRRR